MRPHLAIDPRQTVAGEHGRTTRRRQGPETAIGGAGRRPADRVAATLDPLGNLATDQGV
ncbi:hypothetical protein OOJ91_08560 [Micromonospora lupini]|uniref:hypothetical protein n=1 Tax=Micromonospora lupini TaxID=285679 RepID=UPI002252E872|nr:hypothetical protein [Micromonospora lupini]MCX5065933.1 hypothetical protein [Micromonospora lupini]